MLQSSLSDGVAFDPFSLQKDRRGSAEVDVGRCPARIVVHSF